MLPTAAPKPLQFGPATRCGFGEARFQLPRASQTLTPERGIIPNVIFGTLSHSKAPLQGDHCQAWSGPGTRRSSLVETPSVAWIIIQTSPGLPEHPQLLLSSPAN